MVGSTVGNSTPGDVQQLAPARRGLGVILVVLGIGLLSFLAPVATERRSGDGGSDCGTLLNPSELAFYRPASESAGCAGAMDDAARELAVLAAGAVLLVAAGLSLVIARRIGTAFWVTAGLAVAWAVWGSTQIGSTNLGISVVLFGFVGMVALVLGLFVRGNRDDRTEPR